MQTPQKPITVQRQSVSKLPQATSTPLKAASSKPLPTTAASRTPKDRTPIKPAGQEMHPVHHHPGTAKVLDEARWLGFQALGAYTAPSKVIATGQGTPSKTPAPKPSNHIANATSSPDFRFRFKSPFSSLKGPAHDEAGLSPSSRNILKDAAISGTPGGGSRALFGTYLVARNHFVTGFLYTLNTLLIMHQLQAQPDFPQRQICPLSVRRRYLRER